MRIGLMYVRRPVFAPPVKRLGVPSDDPDDGALLHVLADDNGGGDGKVRRPDVPPSDAVTDRDNTAARNRSSDGDRSRGAGVDRGACRILQ